MKQHGGVSRRAFFAGGLAVSGGAVLLDQMRTAKATPPCPAPGSIAIPAGAGPVYGAELQYFRMAASFIPARLDMCKAAKFTTIQAYVPWNVHENTRGTLDFHGLTHPILIDDHADEYQIETPVQEEQDGGATGGMANTDLAGYLGMCADRGFRVILRPGPFISDEWRNGGLPDWLLDNGYPGIFERGPDGTALTPGFPFNTPGPGGGPLFYFPSPSYASAGYLGPARDWLAAFADFVTPWLATNGGPVVNLQVDDETCYFYRFGPFEVDYHPDMVARYQAVAKAVPPTAWPAMTLGIQGLKPAFGWQSFKAAQIATYLDTLAGDLSSAGVKLPITHELELTLAGPSSFPDDAAVVQLNPEFYPGGTGPWNVPAIELCAQEARAASRHSAPIWAAEMENDEVVLYAIQFGEGILGGLQFTYTAGVPDGALEDLTRLGRTLETAGARLGAATRTADVAIIWDENLIKAPYGSQRWGFSTDVRNIIERDAPALAALLIRAGYSFDLLDVSVAETADYISYPTVFLVSCDILARAAQQDLVSYVAGGGRLVCWPAPPILDENLDPCTILRDALFAQQIAATDPTDGQTISLLGKQVQTWRGVSTFSLTGSAQPMAMAAGKPCGYRVAHGAGEAVLLGTLLAADNVPGRDGSLLESQDIPAGTDAVAAARAMATASLGSAVAAAIPDVLPGGPAQTLLVFAYTNQRRGGMVASGGAFCYWDGENTVGLAEINVTETGQGVTQLPYHPIHAEHIAAVTDLIGRPPKVASTDLGVQTRRLDAPQQGTATVVTANRGAADLTTVITTTVDGAAYRLPTVGALTLPANTALFLPINYQLAEGLTVVQSSAQLVGVTVSAAAAVLSMSSPAGGELIVQLPGAPLPTLLGAMPATAAVSAATRVVTVAVPAGDHDVTLSWTPAAVGCETVATAAPASAAEKRAAPQVGNESAAKPATSRRTGQKALAATGDSPAMAIAATAALAAAAILRRTSDRDAVGVEEQR